jgi:hypothetical protein
MSHQLRRVFPLPLRSTSPLIILSLTAAELTMAKPLNGNSTTAGQSSSFTIDEMPERYEKLEVEGAIFERDYKG